MIRRLLRSHRVGTRDKLQSRRELKPRQRPLEMSVDALEQRMLLATFVVNELSDGPVAAAGDNPGSLRQAIFDANANAGADTIEFALDSGILTLTAGQLEITDDLTINGPGSDKLTINGDNASRIFNIDDGSAATQINVEIGGLTLTEGHVVGAGGAIRSFENLTIQQSSITGNTAVSTAGNFDGYGGGIYAEGSFTVLDSQVADNSADGWYGGGIYAKVTTFVMRHCNILRNTAGFWGGGVALQSYGNASITDSTISGNTGADQADSGGGGISLINRHGNCEIRRTNVTDNGAKEHGGGISAVNSGGTFTIDDCLISGNRVDADEGYGYGAGMALSTFDGARTVIQGGIIAANSASGGGGGIFSRNEGGVVTISDSAIIKNHGRKGGGAYLLTHSAIENTLVVNTTVSDNSASLYGGGIWAAPTFSSPPSSLLMANTTVTGNTAESGGGGVRVDMFGGTLIDVDITNSIIAGNMLSIGLPSDLAGDNLPSWDVDYSLIGVKPSTITGSGLIFGTVGSPYDPMLGPLQYNGGSTPSHALLPGSAAIDAGNNALLPADAMDLDFDGNTTEAIPFDQRGFGSPRALGILSATPTTDMGAFETQDPGASFEDVNDDGFWDYGTDILLDSGELDDGLHSVRGAGGLVVTASTNVTANRVRLLATGSISVDTDLTATSSSVIVRSKQGSVLFKNLEAEASSFLRVPAGQDFFARDSEIRAGTSIDLRGGGVIVTGTSIETAAAAGRVTVSAGGRLNANDTRIAAGRRLNLQATDSIAAIDSVLTASSSAGKLRVQAREDVSLSETDVRATRTIYVRSTRADVNVEHASIGILDGSSAGTIRLQARDNVYLAGALVRAPGLIRLLGELQDEPLADIGLGTLPPV